MSAEFPASRAREFTSNSDNLNCEGWYAKFKDELFYLIKEAALKGHDHLLIHSSKWDNDNVKVNYLKQALCGLGYKAELRNTANYEIEMIISW